ncbi:proline-rich protein HaeIII subfamily 1-like [Zerene cesonia]|uniref:proline-rich protein HaeIII subfamily 1-like n=1 Tax=Zerene cesonia TaxID=33412 RepID=UPI0018E51C1B|nr:proline-rich protein HaeIII subfamily 1-like [Zerene cesonia]
MMNPQYPPPGQNNNAPNNPLGFPPSQDFNGIQNANFSQIPPNGPQMGKDDMSQKMQNMNLNGPQGFNIPTSQLPPGQFPPNFPPTSNFNMQGPPQQFPPGRPANNAPQFPPSMGAPPTSTQGPQFNQPQMPPSSMQPPKPMQQGPQGLQLPNSGMTPFGQGPPTSQPGMNQQQMRPPGQGPPGSQMPPGSGFQNRQLPGQGPNFSQSNSMPGLQQPLTSQPGFQGPPRPESQGPPPSFPQPGQGMPPSKGGLPAPPSSQAQPGLPPQQGLQGIPPQPMTSQPNMQRQGMPPPAIPPQQSQSHPGMAPQPGWNTTSI